MVSVKSYFYSCTREYLDTISTHLYQDLVDAVGRLPKRATQREVNHDFYWILTSRGWGSSAKPAMLPVAPPPDLIPHIGPFPCGQKSQKGLCLTSTTLDAGWVADFGKVFDGKLVQIEVQFGKVELMFKNFCGFKIAHQENRLALGVEIVMARPRRYFAHRLSAVSGMADFDIASKALPLIGLDCPIWLLGIDEGQNQPESPQL